MKLRQFQFFENFPIFNWSIENVDNLFFCIFISWQASDFVRSDYRKSCRGRLKKNTKMELLIQICLVYFGSKVYKRSYTSSGLTLYLFLKLKFQTKQYVAEKCLRGIGFQGTFILVSVHLWNIIFKLNINFSETVNFLFSARTLELVFKFLKFLKNLI